MNKRAVYLPLTPQQQELVRDNMLFVLKIVSTFKKRGHQDDLIAAGNLGLCIAASRFDPKRNIMFTTYSVHWIRAMILSYMLHTHGQMHILSSDQKVFFGLLRTKLKENPEDLETLADRLGTDVDTVNIMQSRVNGRDLMLDAPLPDGKPQDMVDRKLTPEEHFARDEEQEQLQDFINQALQCLNPRERRIIRNRTMADNPRHLRVLGEEMGLSGERVRQLEKRAKEKLRKLFLQAGLSPLLETMSTTPAARVALKATTPHVRARRP